MDSFLSWAPVEYRLDLPCARHYQANTVIKPTRAARGRTGGAEAAPAPAMGRRWVWGAGAGGGGIKIESINLSLFMPLKLARDEQLIRIRR